MPTVMIVDDEELIRSMIRKSLIRIGYEVIEADNGIEAMQLLKGNSVELLIADLVMPKKGGLELIMEVSLVYPNLKKIAISGKLPTENESITELTDSFGVDAIFSKPFEIFDLLKIIKSLVPISNSD